MFVYLEKSYIFALLLFGCKNLFVRNVFSISFPLRVLMSKFFFSVFISVVLTSLETQLVLSKNPHHSRTMAGSAQSPRRRQITRLSEVQR